MPPTTTSDKLGVLVPHWLEHNRNHEAEFRKWAEAARTDGAESLAALLDKAAACMTATGELLKQMEQVLAVPGIHRHRPHVDHHDHG